MSSSGETATNVQSGSESKHLHPAEPQSDALYQKGRLVARILDPEIDLAAKEIRFGEVYNSDELLLPDECEYPPHRILIQKVGYATKVEKESLHKGRILRKVTASILG